MCRIDHKAIQTTAENIVNATGKDTSSVYMGRKTYLKNVCLYCSLGEQALELKLGLRRGKGQGKAPFAQQRGLHSPEDCLVVVVSAT